MKQMLRLSIFYNWGIERASTLLGHEEDMTFGNLTTNEVMISNCESKYYPFLSLGHEEKGNHSSVSIYFHMYLIHTHGWKDIFCSEINFFSHHITHLSFSFQKVVYTTMQSDFFIQHFHSTYYVLASKCFMDINLFNPQESFEGLLYSFYQRRN